VTSHEISFQLFTKISSWDLDNSKIKEKENIGNVDERSNNGLNKTVEKIETDPPKMNSSIQEEKGLFLILK